MGGAEALAPGVPTVCSVSVPGSREVSACQSGVSGVWFSSKKFFAPLVPGDIYVYAIPAPPAGRSPR